jgi:transposase
MRGADCALCARRADQRRCFLAYVEQILVPVLRKGDTVIADNLSSHKNEEAARLIADAGARLLFLPP